jgi:hypothetical protein
MEKTRGTILLGYLKNYTQKPDIKFKKRGGAISTTCYVH